METGFQPVLQDLGKIDPGVFGQGIQPGRKRNVFAHGAQVGGTAVGVKINIDQGNDFAGFVRWGYGAGRGDGAACILFRNAPKANGVPRHFNSVVQVIAFGVDLQIGDSDNKPAFGGGQNDGVNPFCSFQITALDDGFCQQLIQFFVAGDHFAFLAVVYTMWLAPSRAFHQPLRSNRRSKSFCFMTSPLTISIRIEYVFIKWFRKWQVNGQGKRLP